MTHEEFQEQVHGLSDRKLIEQATIAVDNLCKKGGSAFTMHVPPRITDMDILFTELIRRFEERVI